jgi:hypothetical protein
MFHRAGWAGWLVRLDRDGWAAWDVGGVAWDVGVAGDVGAGDVAGGLGHGSFGMKGFGPGTGREVRAPGTRPGGYFISGGPRERALPPVPAEEALKKR